MKNQPNKRISSDIVTVIERHGLPALLRQLADYARTKARYSGQSDRDYWLDWAESLEAIAEGMELS